jgi:hypothetical protein
LKCRTSYQARLHPGFPGGIEKALEITVDRIELKPKVDGQRTSAALRKVIA